ncbi:MAG: antitoxin VapB family protein [Candidatus Lokiarchaeota archaeon]|nr:antitoxin VapB family protein [Candidatus Lokiarchaeota archaeon]
MGYKTISLSDETYNVLKTNKLKGESFNDLILRIMSVPEQNDILKLKGNWKGSIEEVENILDLIYKNREKARIPR